MNPAPIKTKFLVEEFLSAHKKIDTKESVKPEEVIRGLDIHAVILKVKEKARVCMYKPVHIYPHCDKKGVPLIISKTNNDTDTWTCDIGPVDKPMVATLTLDNQKIPLIVTN